MRPRLPKKKASEIRSGPDTEVNVRPWEETTVDLSTVVDPTSTATEQYPRGSDAASKQAVEAHVILIAHPENDALGNRFRLLPGSELQIGRSSRCQVSLPEVRSISRYHARLLHCGQVVEVEDLGSTNGTFVNGRLIARRQPLHSGDRFQVGGVHFKLLHEEDPENAYHEAIYQLVMRDGLTSAYNRRKFTEELEREFDRAVRHNRPLTLMLFDLDHFKRVNDTHGHLAGDAVLQQVARRTLDFLRREQTFARVGGEEFAILSPEIDFEGAEMLAHKLHLELSDAPYLYADEELAVTCSFGVAELTPGMSRSEDLFLAADRAMYLSKDNGRNTVTLASELPDGG